MSKRRISVFSMMVAADMTLALIGSADPAAWPTNPIVQTLEIAPPK